MRDLKNRLKDMVFGNLLVLEYSHHNKNKQIVYKCECQCDNKTIVLATYTDLMKRGKDNCGCLTKQKLSQSKKKYNRYDLSGEYGICYTFKDEEIYFSLKHYDKIYPYCWFLSDEKYPKARGSSGEIKMHRLITDCPKGMVVDHINHNKSDNRDENLRICTNQENTFNSKTPSNNTHGNKGLTKRESGKWRARIWKDGKCNHLGDFDDIEEARNARINAEKEYFGEFANKYEVNNE